MKKFITVCAVIGALALFAGNAQAGQGMYGSHSSQGGYSQGHNGQGVHNGQGGQGWFNQQFFVSPGFGFAQRQPHWGQQNTSHFDFHPAEVVRHRNHLHVNPAHFDLHQTGHYNRNW